MDNFIKEVRIDWKELDKNSYLSEIKALKNLQKLSFDKSISFFTGENGSGKSSLLEAIAINWGFNPEGGTKNYSFSSYDSHSDLNKFICLSKSYRKAEWGYFFRSETFYNVAGMEESYLGGLSARLHERSHGEAFFKVVEGHFKANGLYILDEPEAGLSVQRQLGLMLELNSCVKKGSQFIIATHSPFLLAMPGAAIYSFEDRGVKLCTYQETETYKLTKSFINHGEVFLKSLFED